ncbi:hypothetical protein D3C85_1782090 [compost metagenome]
MRNAGLVAQLLAGTVVDYAAIRFYPEVRINNLVLQLQFPQHDPIRDVLLGQAGHHQAADAVAFGLDGIQIVKQGF